MKNRLAAMLICGLLSACTDGETSGLDTDATVTADAAVDPDMAIAGALSVTAVNPTGGPEAGTTVVVISGQGFEEGATVSFGETAATGVAVNSARSIRATAPAGAGVVSVSVTNPDGESVSLANAYTYRGAVDNAVDWCTIQFPATLSSAPGAEAGPVFARVFEEGCTEGEVLCGRIEAELGYGAAGVDISQTPDAWTWLAAAPNPAHVADNNDEFSASLTVAEAGTYGYAFRMRIDGGAWSYCDLDGTDNGYSADQAGSLSVQEGVQSVGWCALHHPPSLSVTPGAETEAIYGRFFVEGCTEGAEKCADVRAELGWGDPAVDAGANPGAWQWVEGTFNPDHTADNNDEHFARVTPANAGTYAYAWRVTVDGENWTYCDLDGSENGYQPEQAGSLTVAEDNVEIGWCTIQFPAEANLTAGQSAEIFGRAYVEGCTDGDAQCPVLLAELGYGVGEDTDAFQWVQAAYNGEHTADDNDEFRATIERPAVGDYRYAYRVSVGDGNWVLCDLDGSENGFDAAQMGTLTVAEPAQPTVGWCTLQFPAQIDATTGSAATIFGRAFVAGCSEGDAQCDGLRAEIGYGAGEDPATFQWQAAAYNPDHIADDNDEFSATLMDLPVGNYRYAFRAALGDEAWMLCDLDGTENGFAPAQMGTLRVTDPVGPSLGWCALHFPAEISAQSDEAVSIYGRAFVADCTEGEAACANLRTQVGYGVGDDPAAFEWVDAAYNEEHTADDNDESWASIGPLASGDYRYAFRAALGDAPWTLCDLDGSENGFDPGQMGRLSVEAPGPDVTIGWCQVQHPASTSTAPSIATESIFGRVWVDGCTAGDAQCAAVTAEVGYGPAGAVPSANWSWAPAAYNAAHVADDNDEYQGTLTVAEPELYGYGYRFSVDGGTSWTYCDTQGDDAELTVEAVPQLTVAAREIGWCNIQFPGQLEGNPGDGVGPVYGRVFVAGCSEGAAACHGLRMQVGLGASDSDPREAAWRYFDGQYNPEHTADNNDEFLANVELSDGQDAFIVRFSGDGGASWSYCDVDGGDFSTDAMGTIVAP